MTSYHDFASILNDSIKEQFSNTTIFIIDNGDDIKDTVFELRENNSRMKYSPYELYIQSENYEETIEYLLKRWKSIIQRN